MEHSKEDDAAADRTTQPPLSSNSSSLLSLPPLDENMVELERLLAQAKVGTHELQSSGESSPQQQEKQRMTDTTSAQNFAEQLHDACLEVESNDENNHTDVEEKVDDDEASAVLVEPPTGSGTSSSASSTHTANNIGVVMVEVPSEEEEQVHHSTGNTSYRNQQLAVPETPKFRFVSDDTTVPEQLSSIQRQSLRNRHMFQTRLHDVECRIALLTAQLADEERNLQQDVKNAVQSCVYQPLQKVMDSVMSSSSSPNIHQRWISLEQKCSQLDAQMTHGIHVQMHDLRRQQSATTSDEASSNSNTTTPISTEQHQQSLHSLSVTADTQEAAQARRWEAHVGSMERRYQEEHATRQAVLSVMDQQLHKLHPHRGQELLAQVRSLRSRLAAETEERIARDDQIREYIVHSTGAMQQAILGVYEDE